ncbi:MAG: DsbA family protein, partial [Microthrixaceae bacterium]
HRVIQWAQATHPDLADTAADRFFKAYFTDGANIADHAVLTDLAVEVGLDRDEVTEVLASNAFADEVVADQRSAAELGVTGVPAIAVNGAVVIPGAQDVDTVETVLRRLLERVG